MYNELLKEAQDIQSFTEIEMSEEMTEAVLRGNTLNVYIARTGKMLADAKKLLNQKKKSETMQVIDTILKKNHISAKIQNALIDSVCAEEEYLVNWIERLNRTCTHQVNWCRTVVSKGKEEMRLSGML